MKKLAKNYLLVIFFGIVSFVFLISVYRLFYSKPTYIYVKVKIGQGYWWASTNNPSTWLIDSIKKGNKQYDTIGKKVAEILSSQYYPIFSVGVNTQFYDQYRTYLTLKLKVSGNNKFGYSFQRSAIAVGSPIDFDFPSAQFSGTVIQLSNKPIVEKLVKKTVYLTKKSNDPDEFNSIKIGQNYFDGENEVIKIMDKYFDGTNITIKALFKLKEKNNQFILGEEEVIAKNKVLGFMVSDLLLYNFTVEKIE